MLVTFLVNVDGITLEFDFGTELVSVDVSFGGYNNFNLYGLMLG